MADISICTPTWKRDDRLCHTLESYETCGYFDLSRMNGLDVEVSACWDGESTFKPGHGFALTKSVCDRPYGTDDVWMNPCVPLNTAVENSSGTIIILTEPEVYHTKPVILDMLDLMDAERDVVMCPCKSVGHKGWEWYAHPVHRDRPAWWFMMMSRRFWDMCGGFDPRYRLGVGWDDDDFIEHMMDQNVRLKWLETGDFVTHPFMGRKPKGSYKYADNRELFVSIWGEDRIRKDRR